MTTNQTNIPEPTSRTEVVVGKRNGETVVAVLDHDDDYPWVVQTGDHRHCWRSWTGLCRDLTDIRVVDLARIGETVGYIKDLEASVAHLSKGLIEPGPWLRGDELGAAMPTLKAGDVVEVEYAGHTATGELWGRSRRGLALWEFTIRVDDKPGPYVGALRIIERRAPEPGADIPDEVIEAARAAYEGTPYDSPDPLDAIRAALAAADAKRAELEGGEQA